MFDQDIPENMIRWFYCILHIPSAVDDGFRLPIIHLLHSLVSLCLGVASPLYKLGTVISFNRV